MANDEHHHDHGIEDDESYGIALGFRIIEDGGQLFLAEAEISAYQDEPGELGVTLVFHPLDGVDPVDPADEQDWPAWPMDLDDDLTRNPSDPIPAQFAAIARQLRGIPEEKLREYLGVAREEAEG